MDDVVGVGRAHASRHVVEAVYLFQPYPSFDFRGFSGTLRVVSRDGLIAATAPQLGDDTGQFAALPVKAMYR